MVGAGALGHRWPATRIRDPTVALRWPCSLGVFAPIFAFLLISLILIVGATLWLRRFERGPMEIATHAAHTWLARNTTGRVSARRRPAR